MILKNIIYKYFKLFYYYVIVLTWAIRYIYITFDNIETTTKSNNHINKNSKILFNNYFDKLNSTYI